jgi:hypothetical protein
MGWVPKYNEQLVCVVTLLQLGARQLWVPW